jgi:hypothetical protein
MKKANLFSVLVLLLNFSAFAFDSNTLKFPTNPHPVLTPGAICKSSGQVRYPEKVSYCAREVSSQQKQVVMQKYDSQLGYQVTKMERSSFKIDHLIPLCMGGANEESNLWPQHTTVYFITDPIEPALCNRMAQGQMRQSDAIAIIKRAKNDLNYARQLVAEMGLTPLVGNE